MKISVIVPTNSIKRINEFINEYDNLNNFYSFANLIIIGNGEVEEENIPILPKVHFIRYEKVFNIIPFTELRGIGMETVNPDFFLFLDDDHRFNENSDIFLVRCINFLQSHKECGVLQLRKRNIEKNSFYVKRNAHIWTDRGLFIRNINFEYKKLYQLIGACEDLLYSYEVLNKSYIPYEVYNAPIERGCTLPNNYKELNDKSYNEKVLDENIIGYIREKYNEQDWKFYGNLKYLSYPFHLKNLIKSRLSNLI